MRAHLFALLLAAPAHAATVAITIAGVRNDHGHVLVAICPKSTFLQPHCPRQGSAPAHPGEVLVTIQNVPPGTYAAQAFHDEDDNGKLEKTFFGLPKEGIGFSNNAPMRFGPPNFDTASFSVATEAVETRFELKYY